MIIPAVLGSSSQVLDMGTAVRLFPSTIRRAITLRDRGCTFPGCDRPATWCDAHHAIHVRREALVFRLGVRDPRRRAVTAVW